jgi:predicted RNA binding protein YcfA (HicA-like mRNA interferase family)
MPRKIRELIQELVRAGFADRGGRGSHRNYEHPSGARVTISGQPGDDAKPYQEREVRRAVAESTAADGSEEPEDGA